MQIIYTNIVQMYKFYLFIDRFWSGEKNMFFTFLYHVMSAEILPYTHAVFCPAANSGSLDLNLCLVKIKQVRAHDSLL